MTRVHTQLAKIKIKKAVATDRVPFFFDRKGSVIDYGELQIFFWCVARACVTSFTIGCFSPSLSFHACRVCESVSTSGVRILYFCLFFLISLFSYLKLCFHSFFSVMQYKYIYMVAFVFFKYNFTFSSCFVSVKSQNALVLFFVFLFVFGVFRIVGFTSPLPPPLFFAMITAMVSFLFQDLACEHGLVSRANCCYSSLVAVFFFSEALLLLLLLLLLLMMMTAMTMLQLTLALSPYCSVA